MQINENNAGLAAEKIAETFLLSKGLILIAKNYHCKYGEIDLIMRDNKTTVFVEVRLRSNSTFGGAGMSITKQKQAKLTHTAEHYLQQHGTTACRFDAVLMHQASIDAIEWLQNIF